MRHAVWHCGSAVFVTCLSLTVLAMPMGVASAADAIDYSTVTRPETERLGKWAVDPNDPGPNLPPAGRSLFDWLFTTKTARGRVYDVPFPFTRVIERVEQQLATKDKSDFSGLKSVLIPLGRSLQRNAAGPNYFEFPRIVIAVDTESRNPIPLKDRLFLGYQEKSNSIEIISYNETAGRFEFQVVKNYGLGRRAEVRYADRAICTSCHQNGAAIFSKAPWDETNFNVDVATRLGRYRPLYQGVQVRDTGAKAGAIDSATDRANLFSSYQLLWREGCGADKSRREAIRCRAGALTAMLQRRLSAFSYFDARSPLYQDYFIPISTMNWRERWPMGLRIPDPDIPNRRSLLTPSSTDTDVPAKLDPLHPRPARTTWSADRDLGRAVTGLSDLLLAQDIRRLDAHLFRKGFQANAERQDFQGPCKLRARGELGGGDLVNVECRLVHRATGQAINLVVDAVVESDGVISERINWLRVVHDMGFAALVLAGGPIRRAGEYWTAKFELRQRYNDLHGRLPNGSAIAGLRLRWPNTAKGGRLFSSFEESAGEATLTVMHDFHPVHEAIAAMVTLSDENQLDVFANMPFQGTRVMQALFAQLGLRAVHRCCDDVHQMPPAIADTSADVDGLTRAASHVKRNVALRTFYRHCGTCHQSDAKLPPGFLSGDEGQVTANLAQCAPRILFRLKMWQMDDDERAKTPMPPLNSLDAYNYSAERWRDSSELMALKQYTENLSMARVGRVQSPGNLAQVGYESLPPCLP